MQVFIRVVFSALMFSASCGAAGAAEDVKKLPGTAGTFAGVPWGSSPETIKSLLAQRDYDYVTIDQDGDLVFSAKNPPANVFEVLDKTQRLIKVLVVMKPPATSLTNFFETASAALVKKYGKPSETVEGFSGPYKDAKSDSDRRAAIAAGDGTLANEGLQPIRKAGEGAGRKRVF